MKTDLTDVTFLILVRLDSIERLENILCITERLTYYFKTNIVVREADSYNNGILKSLLNKQIYYEFIEDKDPVLYKTRHINLMSVSVKTSYLAIWDADIIVDKKVVADCMDKLRKKEADVVYPYNGICFDIPDIIKNVFFRRKDHRFLLRHKNKMDRLYSHLLTGGAVIVNRKMYIAAGMENEKHYGWGNDDSDRYNRFVVLGYKIYRVNVPLFHLSHFRSNNSQFKSFIESKMSAAICTKIHDSSMEELQNYIKLSEI